MTMTPTPTPPPTRPKAALSVDGSGQNPSPRPIGQPSAEGADGLRTVLVANRGEIACRVIRSLRAAGIRSVAVYSDADADARHVREADVAVRLGPAPATASYLDIDAVLAACRATGAQAVHPGYGFLAENAHFAQAVLDADLIWIGPSPEAIDGLGDKVKARHIATRAEAPLVPGTKDPVADADEVPDGDDSSVVLMTLHTAKGLEFDTVFLIGMEDGVFPHIRSLDDPDELEEERRLAYVGITRARESLVLCYAESRRMHGQEMYGRPSRFLGEIPPALLSEVRPRVQVSRPAWTGGHARLDEAPALKLGQRVRHATFGAGVVVDSEGTGAHTRVQVNFEDGGQKWLVLAYANLVASP